MKATGVVRRIDELGRIVIPKEIRKTLRIREGENLEIFLDDQENIVLKKYFALNHFAEEAKTFVDTIYHLTRHSVIITDTDKVIAMAGVEKELLDQKPISEQLKDIIARRDKMFERNKKKDTSGGKTRDGSLLFLCDNYRKRRCMWSGLNI